MPSSYSLKPAALSLPCLDQAEAPDADQEERHRRQHRYYAQQVRSRGREENGDE